MNLKVHKRIRYRNNNECKFTLNVGIVNRLHPERIVLRYTSEKGKMNMYFLANVHNVWGLSFQCSCPIARALLGPL